MIIESGQRVNPRIRYEIFIHKVDQLSEEAKIETQRDIHNQVRDRFPNETARPDTCTFTQPRSSSLSTTPVRDSCSSFTETTNEDASNVFDSMSSSIVKLTGGRALYLKEINRHLALICVLREEALTKQAIIEYNVNQLKKSILELFRLTHLTSPVA
ncbi:unnamed protein product [Rotaria magnacalcarata]